LTVKQHNIQYYN